jgi:hypothetical protein
MPEKFTSPLDNLRIAAPCPAQWEEMDGDDRKRFCQACKMNVYNLSGMSKTEAENLLQNQAGRLCLRMFQREDGTVITDNCPVGVRLIRRKLAWVAGGIAAGFFFAASGALAMWGKMSGRDAPTLSVPSKPRNDPDPVAPVQALTNWANPPAPAPAKGVRMVMGEMCPAPSAPAVKPVPTPPAPASTAK